MQTFEEWLKVNQPEYYTEVDWGKIGRKAALGGALVGAGMGLGRFMGGEQPRGSVANPPAATQMDQNFWQSGVFTQGNAIVSKAIDVNPQAAHAKAVNQLAQHLGTNRIPSGVESSTQQQDGAYAVTLTLRAGVTQQAQQAARQMQ